MSTIGEALRRWHHLRLLRSIADEMAYRAVVCAWGETRSLESCAPRPWPLAKDLRDWVASYSAGHNEVAAQFNALRYWWQRPISMIGAQCR